MYSLLVFFNCELNKIFGQEIPIQQSCLNLVLCPRNTSMYDGIALQPTPNYRISELKVPKQASCPLEKTTRAFFSARNLISHGEVLQTFTLLYRQNALGQTDRPKARFSVYKP